MQTEFETLSEEVLVEKENKSRGVKFLIVGLIFVVLFGVTLYHLVQTYFLVDISGASMQPTLYDGETVLCNRNAQAKVGDVVVIDGESYSGYIIKRVVAVGGQTVQIKDGYVFVDGVRLEETYAEGQTLDNDGKWTEPRVVNENEIFYLGDNRLVSKDSRSQSFGPCLVEQIVGVVPDWAITIKPLTTFFF